jgi:rhodanese-related sulfurtransferase
MYKVLKMAAPTSISYIEASALADAIRTGSSSGVVVVDVRDDDFEGGNIVGANNAPTECWAERAFVDELITSMALDSTKTIVFHCMKSQVRGPTCARMFAEKLSTLPAGSQPQM